MDEYACYAVECFCSTAYYWTNGTIWTWDTIFSEEKCHKEIRENYSTVYIVVYWKKNNFSLN